MTSSASLGATDPSALTSQYGPVALPSVGTGFEPNALIKLIISSASPATTCPSGKPVGPVTSRRFAASCHTWALVMLIVNVCGPVASLPPPTVPPSSISTTVTWAEPATFGWGVNVSLPVASIVGCIAKKALLSLVTAKCSFCPASLGGPADRLVAQLGID